LDQVKSLLRDVEKNADFKITVHEKPFCAREMSSLATDVIPELKMDYAVLVVHANDLLPFTEDGYGKICKAIMQKSASGGNLIIIICGDKKYKDEEEENRAVFSQWAWKNISTQCCWEYLDRSQVFMFSWNETHRKIHEEALIHFLDPSKKGEKFVPQPRVHRKNNPVTQNVPAQRPSVGSKETRPRNNNNPTADGARQSPTQGAAAFTEGSQTTYPPNTVLLSTRMRYGVISYNSDDVETWRDDKKWRPSSVEARRVAQEWQSIPTAQIKLVTDKNGVVQVSIRDETTLADRVWSICSIS